MHCEGRCSMMRDYAYDKTAVGARIREKRLALHLTQDDLADKTERSMRLIAEIERGNVGMSIETFLSVCNALKVTPNDLLLPAPTPIDSELDWAIQALTNSSGQVRSVAIDILRAYLRST